MTFWIVLLPLLGSLVIAFLLLAMAGRDQANREKEREREILRVLNHDPFKFRRSATRQNRVSR